MIIIESDKNDLKDILELQKLSYQQEAHIYNDYNIPPLKQTYDEILNEYDKMTILKAVKDNKIVGSVRAYENNNSCYIGRLIVHPDFQNDGVGTNLMKTIESKFPNVNRFELFTGYKSDKNLYLYKKLGYEEYKRENLSDSIIIVYLEKMK